MKRKDQGFTLVETLLMLVILVILVTAGLFVYRQNGNSTIPIFDRSSSVKIGNYKLWLDANEDDNFNIYYSLGLTATQNVIPEGQSGKIKVVKLKVAKSSGKQIVIDALTREESWTRPSCELIESWDCDPPALETKVDLPKLTSGQASSLALLLNIDGKNHNYTINTKDYKLSISGENGFNTNTVPLYPNGIASAIAVNQTKNSMCEGVSSSQIIERLRTSGVQLASDKYSGIEDTRPGDVLAYVPGKRLNDIVAPIDINDCVIKVIPANLK